MTRYAPIMTPEQRQLFADRIEVLEKVKALILIPELCMLTTEQVADFFEVPAETIRSVYARNRAELDANGTVFMSPSQFEGQKLQNATSVRENRNTMLYCVGDVYFTINNRGVRLYPPRAILNMAMLLKDSPVAEEVRTQLLNLAEASPAKTRVANIEGQEQIASRLVQALMANDFEAFMREYIDMDKLKNHRISQLSNANTALEAKAEALQTKAKALEGKVATLNECNSELTAENTQLVQRNESLRTSNRMLAEEAMVWDPKAVVNAVVREVASLVFNKKYGLAWNEFYRELKYQTGLCIEQRGSRCRGSSSLSTIREEEWPKVMRVVAAFAYRYCVDVVEVTNRQTVEHYELDRIDTDEGVRFNRGIVRTMKAAYAEKMASLT